MRYYQLIVLFIVLLAAALFNGCGNNVSQPTEPISTIESENSTESQEVLNNEVLQVSPRFPVDGTKWYHYPTSPYHKPSSGRGRADDTYALDLNLSGNADNGKAVFAIEAGTVKQVSTSAGWVLIEHSGTISWKGRNYSTWWSGYLHMSNIAVSTGQQVSKGKQIGKVSNVGTKDAHLHFAAYVGTLSGASSSYPNAFLLSVDPGTTLGASYTGFTYGNAIYDNWVDDIASSGNYIFERGGSSSDWFERSDFGFFGHMFYTKGRSGTTDDNWGRWRFNDGVPATASDWKIYVFIARNYATATRALYKISKNNSYYKQFTINQSSYYDYWVNSSDLSFSQGQTIQVYLGDSNNNSGKLVAYDKIRRWKKNDKYLYQ